MGLADKKRDILVSIQGESAKLYKKDVTVLIAGELPPHWQIVHSSKETFVAFNKKINIYYKEFLHRNKFEKFKALLRGSRCQRAIYQTAILQKENLPTPNIVCWGKGKKNTFLISEGFAGVGFYDYLITHFSPPLSKDQIQGKRILLKETGSLIGRLHRKGIIHGDLRPNNLLVKWANGVFQFSFIDTESNRIKKIFSSSLLKKNLVQFAMIKNDCLSRSDLLRLYRAYRTQSPSLSKKDERPLLKSIYLQSKKRVLDAVVSNSFRKNYRSFQHNVFHGKYVKHSLLEKQITDGYDLKEWFDSGQKYLKKDKSISIKLLISNGNEIVAKRFLPKGGLYHLKVWLGKERVFRLFEMSHYFMALGIPIAKPIGYALEGKGVWRTVSYFYSQYLKGKSDLKGISQSIKKFPSWLNNKKIISQFADILAILHNNGFCHGDTKWKNIIADQETGELWLIDLDGVTTGNRQFCKAMCKDLSRFIVDIIEYRLPNNHVKEFINQYCKRRNLKRSLVMKKIEPVIKKILKRHRKKANVAK